MATHNCNVISVGDGMPMEGLWRIITYGKNNSFYKAYCLPTTKLILVIITSITWRKVSSRIKAIYFRIVLMGLNITLEVFHVQCIVMPLDNE